jgi:hypothetical protein
VELPRKISNALEAHSDPIARRTIEEYITQLDSDLSTIEDELAGMRVHVAQYELGRDAVEILGMAIRYWTTLEPMLKRLLAEDEDRKSVVQTVTTGIQQFTWKHYTAGVLGLALITGAVSWAELMAIVERLWTSP